MALLFEKPGLNLDIQVHPHNGTPLHGIEANNKIRIRIIVHLSHFKAAGFNGHALAVVMLLMKGANPLIRYYFH